MAGPKQIKMDAFSLCPWRSPVVPREPSRLTLAGGEAAPTEPLQAIGPCLGLGCGLWMITKMVEGQPREGCCSIKFIAMAMNEGAGALQVMTQIGERLGAKFGVTVPGRLQPPTPPKAS